MRAAAVAAGEWGQPARREAWRRCFVVWPGPRLRASWVSLNQVALWPRCVAEAARVLRRSTPSRTGDAPPARSPPRSFAWGMVKFGLVTSTTPLPPPPQVEEVLIPEVRRQRYGALDLPVLVLVLEVRGFGVGWGVGQEN